MFGSISNFHYGVALALIVTGTCCAFAQSQAKKKSPPLIPVYRSQEIITGVTTSADGRVFVEYPHLDGSPGMRVAELKDGKPYPYPNEAWNSWKSRDDPTGRFVRVNSIRIGPDGTLWVVDTGTPSFGGKIIPGGVKLVAIDPTTNKVRQSYALDSATSPDSFVDDVRFNGSNAYLTDAGIPGIIVLNLKTGATRRALDHDVSTTDQRPLVASGNIVRTSDGKEVSINADQLEVSPDGKLFYYQPLSGPMYRIETRYLDDASLSPAELAQHSSLFAETPTTGGTAIDAVGNIYLSDVNKRSIVKITPDGTKTTLIQDDRLDWSDALWIDQRGYLWMPVAQLDQIPQFQGGASRVRLPIVIYKMRIDQRSEY